MFKPMPKKQDKVKNIIYMLIIKLILQLEND